MVPHNAYDHTSIPQHTAAAALVLAELIEDDDSDEVMLRPLAQSIAVKLEPTRGYDSGWGCL